MTKTIKFVNECKAIFGEEYDYSKVEYTNLKTKVEIVCPTHGSFHKTPHHHKIRKQGCPKCSNAIKSKNNTKTTEKFIKQSIVVHGDRYDYSKVAYEHAKRKVSIICPKHGEFRQTPDNHLQGNNCPKCVGKSMTNEDILIKFNETHSNKYDYSNVYYVNGKTKVKIICPEHGEFKQLPYPHINGQGCPRCFGLNKTNEIFINDSKLIHGDRYDYSKIEYINNKCKVIIKCPEHGEFKQTPNMHLQGNGCPTCKESVGEKLVRGYLICNNINFSPQHSFNECKNVCALPFDFYLPEYNVCIEYDGIQHFKPISFFGGIGGFNNRKRNDNIKNRFCENNNIDLLRIPYDSDVFESLSNFFTNK